MAHLLEVSTAKESTAPVLSAAEHRELLKALRIAELRRRGAEATAHLKKHPLTES